MDVSLKQLINEVEDLCNAHAQIESFHYGDTLSLLQHGSIDYITCLMNVARSPMGNAQTTFSIELLILDRVITGDDENKLNSENITHSIVRDLINVIGYSTRWRTFSDFTTNAPSQKYYDEFADAVTGWGVTIDLQVYNSNGICDLPVFDYDFNQPPPEEVCEPVTVTDSDGTTETEVPSGGSFNCTVIPDSLYYPTKTGNSSFISGDDGITQTGRNVDYNTLDFTNPYGNTDRWTNDKGGDYNDNSDGSTVDYVVDNSLKKGFKKTYGVRRTMQGHLSFAPTLTIGSYSGFTVANFNEYSLVLQPNSFLPNTSVFGNPDFNIILINKFRNSTTCFRAISNSAIAQFSAVGSTPYQTMFIRNHTY